MKKEINFTHLGKIRSTELTTIVPETIAKDVFPAKSFTVVDLWNIQRRSKTTMSSRKLVALQ